MNAEALFAEAFPAGREPRSREYKAGVLACLRYRIEKSQTEHCPYRVETSARDAWYAGWQEGAAIVKRLEEDAP